MLRAAAKNHEHVVVIVDPADYAEVLESLAHGGTSIELRRRLAAKAFAHTAAYDGRIANWLGARIGGDTSEAFAPTLHLSFERKQVLRYGENPHQGAALYVQRELPPGTVAGAQVLAGKELSFNNLADADAALECVKAFQRTPACVIVKHANPCGVALGESIGAAYDLAYACDPVSAFGGIIAFNHRLDAATAARILDRQFVEVVIAPEVDADAVEVFARKPNVPAAAGAWPEHMPTMPISSASPRLAGHRP